MNSPEFKDTVCRICLDENVVLDWSNTLAEHCEITYKDCYYKYTQLELFDDDPFSSMLCQNCLNSLENVHTLILKAIDSYNFLLEVNCMSCEVEDSTVIDDVKYASNGFETVLVEKTDTESVIGDQYEYENFDEFFNGSSLKVEDDKFNISATNTVEMQIVESFDIEYEECDIDKSLRLENFKDSMSNSMRALCRKSKRNNSIKSVLIEEDSTYNDGRRNIEKKLRTSLNNSRHKKGTRNESDEDPMNKKIDGDTSKRRKVKTKYKSENTPSMCSFCSKILHNKYSLQKHEKTHNVNRERKATCPICGVKYFEKAYLKAHMHIHSDNRVKKHKCEFCDKAFYEKGGLNVHRRIHLGQMIPCNLCPKEFFRQVDLDIHMNSHSATLITAETKKRSRYWVRCKYCNKTIMSTSFKSHTAAHLNEPLMKCSICSKEFFRRDSCTQHLKSIHQKTTEEYNDFIVLYNKNRLSHLYLEQKAEIQVNEN